MKNFFSWLFAQDSSDGPKNESLADHLKHCEAKPGNCPFEKKVSEESIKEDSLQLMDGEKEVTKTNQNNVEQSKDSEYADAVKRGDMATAQRMVFDAAKRVYGDSLVMDNDGNPVVFYRGDTKRRNVFDPKKDKNGFGDVYFTDNRDYAGKYGKEVQACLLVVNNPSVHNFKDEGFANALTSRFKGNDAAFVYGVTDFTGIKHGEVLMRKMNNIKSADPVTYDDAGNVIPLSKRFSLQNNDIRW